MGYAGDDFPGHGGGGHDYPQYRDYLAERGFRFAPQIASTGAAKYGRLDGPVEATVDYFLAERALTHLQGAQASGRPFFYALNFWGPHEPCLMPQAYLDRYNPGEIAPWPSFNERAANKPSIHAVKRPPGLAWPDFALALQHYYAHITVIDEQIGRVLEWLRASGLYENTAVIFTADHGESLGIHGGLTDKSIFMYEETCRIPLLIKPAQCRSSGARSAGFANTTDIYSTVLDIAGRPRDDAERDGRSLCGWLEGCGPSDWPDHTVTQAAGLAHLGFCQRMLRWGEWEYVFNCGDLDELYDLAYDPHELTNLVNSPEARIRLVELREILRAWLVAHHDPLLQAFERMRLA